MHKSIAENVSGTGTGGGSSAASTFGAGSPERSTWRAAGGAPLDFDICSTMRIALEKRVCCRSN